MRLNRHSSLVRVGCWLVAVLGLTCPALAEETPGPVELTEGRHEIALRVGTRSEAGVAVTGGMVATALTPKQADAPEGVWAGTFLDTQVEVGAPDEDGQRTIVIRRGDKELSTSAAPRQIHGAGDSAVHVWPFRAEVDVQGSTWRPILVYKPSAKEIALRARATTYRFPYADVTVGGQAHKLVLLDGDADGRFGGEADAWRIVSRQQIDARGARPFNAACLVECDEPVFLAPTLGARLKVVGDGVATIEVAPTKESFGDYLARRADRVARDFKARVDENAGLAKRIENMREADRKLAETAIAWTWTHDLDAARALAAANEKPLLAVFETDWCAYCKILALLTWPDAEVADFVRETFVAVRVHGDFLERADITRELGVTGYPTAVVFDTDGEVLDRIPGFLPPSRYVERLKAALARKEGLPGAADADASPPADAPKVPGKAVEPAGKADEDESGAPEKKPPIPATPLGPAQPAGK